MRPFDQNYMERREKRIRELYTLRAVSRAMGLISILTLIATVVISSVVPGMVVPLGLIMLSTGSIAVITFMIANAETAAEEAIQKERNQLAALYDQEVEKPKRQQSLRLSDDGELVADDEGTLDAQMRDNDRRSLN